MTDLFQVIGGAVRASAALVPPAHHSAPPGTSDAAARSMIGPAQAQRRAVLQAIEDCGDFGATDQEIETTTGFSGNAVRPRRGELQKLGLVMDSGRRRRTESGRMAAVWIRSGNRMEVGR